MLSCAWIFCSYSFPYTYNILALLVPRPRATHLHILPPIPAVLAMSYASPMLPRCIKAAVRYPSPTPLLPRLGLDLPSPSSISSSTPSHLTSVPQLWRPCNANLVITMHLSSQAVNSVRAKETRKPSYCQRIHGIVKACVHRESWEKVGKETYEDYTYSDNMSNIGMRMGDGARHGMHSDKTTTIWTTY